MVDLNRIIKFRAWNKEYKVWVNVYSLKFQTNGVWLIAGNGAGYSPNSIELMQYTGLKDKNGKEIYEGDILAPNDREVQFGVYHSPLEQGNGVYTLCHNLEYPQIPFSFSERQSEASEVIGNIYENKELLDG